MKEPPVFWSATFGIPATRGQKNTCVELLHVRIGSRYTALLRCVDLNDPSVLHGNDDGPKPHTRHGGEYFSFYDRRHVRSSLWYVRSPVARYMDCF